MLDWLKGTLGGSAAPSDSPANNNDEHCTNVLQETVDHLQPAVDVCFSNPFAKNVVNFKESVGFKAYWSEFRQHSKALSKYMAMKTAKNTYKVLCEPDKCKFRQIVPLQDNIKKAVFEASCSSKKKTQSKRTKKSCSSSKKSCRSKKSAKAKSKKALLLNKVAKMCPPKTRCRMPSKPRKRCDNVFPEPNNYRDASESSGEEHYCFEKAISLGDVFRFMGSARRDASIPRKIKCSSCREGLESDASESSESSEKVEGNC